MMASAASCCSVWYACCMSGSSSGCMMLLGWNMLKMGRFCVVDCLFCKNLYAKLKKTGLFLWVRELFFVILACDSKIKVKVLFIF